MNIKVKPLAWWTPSAKNNYTHGAETIFGTYYVGICGGRHNAHAEFFHEGKRIEQYFGDDRGTLLGAKSDAQAHHEARILSAIDTTSCKCKTCGAEGVREFGNDDGGPDNPSWIGQTDGKDVCHSCEGVKSESDIRANERAKVLGRSGLSFAAMRRTSLGTAGL